MLSEISDYFYSSVIKVVLFDNKSIFLVIYLSTILSTLETGKISKFVLEKHTGKIFEYCRKVVGFFLTNFSKPCYIAAF